MNVRARASPGSRENRWCASRRQGCRRRTPMPAPCRRCCGEPRPQLGFEQYRVDACRESLEAAVLRADTRGRVSALPRLAPSGQNPELPVVRPGFRRYSVPRQSTQRAHDPSRRLPSSERGRERGVTRCAGSESVSTRCSFIRFAAARRVRNTPDGDSPRLDGYRYLTDVQPTARKAATSVA